MYEKLNLHSLLIPVLKLLNKNTTVDNNLITLENVLKAKEYFHWSILRCHDQNLFYISAFPDEYIFLTASVTIFPTESVLHVGGKDNLVNCTPPMACLALSSALIAPWVDVAGTVA